MHVTDADATDQSITALFCGHRRKDRCKNVGCGPSQKMVKNIGARSEDRCRARKPSSVKLGPVCTHAISLASKL